MDLKKITLLPSLNLLSVPPAQSLYFSSLPPFMSGENKCGIWPPQLKQPVAVLPLLPCFLEEARLLTIESYSDQWRWWLWDIAASTALWHLLMLFPADPRPQRVSTQHIFPLSTGRVCIPGLLFLKAAVTSPVTARRHEAAASAKEPRSTTVPGRPQVCTSELKVAVGEPQLSPHQPVVAQAFQCGTCTSGELVQGSFSNPYMQGPLDSWQCWSLGEWIGAAPFIPTMCLFAPFSPGTYPRDFVVVLPHKSHPLHSLPNLHQIKFQLSPR